MESLMEEVRRWFKIFKLTFFQIPSLAATVFVGKYIYPPVADRLNTMVEDAMSVTHYSKEDYMGSVLSFQFIKSVYKSLLIQINMKAKRGQKAPNTTIVSTDGNTYKKILDLQQKDRPLILNFGSCT